MLPLVIHTSNVLSNLSRPTPALSARPPDKVKQVHEKPNRYTVSLKCVQMVNTSKPQI